MSRTGIHGGIRRGTAAAAVGAVLVLSTGVQASLADDAVPPPQDPAAAPAATAAAFGLSITAGQTAPATPGPGGNGGARQPDEGRGSDEASASAPATRIPRTPSSIPAVPGALLPVITASPSAAWTSPAPGPTSSGTPLAPSPQTTSAAAPTGSQAAAGPAPASGPAAVPAPAAAPAAPATQAAGATGLPGAPVGAGQPGTAQGGTAQGGPAQGGAAPTAGAQPALPAAGGEAGVPVPGTVQAGGEGSALGTVTASPLPTALSINARNSQPVRLPQAAGPQAAGPQAGPGRAVSSTGPLPDVPDAMIWLGAGLVGVGAAAGLVFLRMRRL